MNCSLAREALSARIDGEREPVPRQRTDKHLKACAECRAWYQAAAGQAQGLRDLARVGGLLSLPGGVEGAPASPVDRSSRLSSLAVVGWARCALALVGVVSLVLTAMQLTFGPSQRSDALGIHLFGESTAWSIAVGVAMIFAGVTPAAAAGLVGVLGIYSIVLAVYVVVDAADGVISPIRELVHIPVVAGAVLAFLVWRGSRSPRPAPSGAAVFEPDRASAVSTRPIRAVSTPVGKSPRGGSAA
ncbi:hypothetical protein CRM90_28945 [Mycobacterium sp. ENV421]|uniref:zf-HC2 domain-containing protein n=1 Tax=Mycobacterium sp. ENV421 TaxID=1213407 RepID=UPI000C99C0AA|nr:zf-HC2 domain-containing protein [Mycobacterium sp. ENV421]PND54260.1 hypothetical protein CRM90_28945 [Mycobacterium sp. ENV421]